MVDFGSDYWHTLSKPKNLRIKELGVSSKMGEVVQNLKADITAGASHVEIGFMGKEKGSLGNMNTTPEMFDKTKREQIRQLSKINKVSVSTHASIGISGLTGIDQQNGRFSDTEAEKTLNELKRTIDFAGDACEGGAVVVHTSEFKREVSQYEEFEPPFGIQKEEIVSLVDSDTGKFIQFQKGQKIHVPKEWKHKKGRNGEKVYLDLNGNPVKDEFDYLNMVPESSKDGDIGFEVWDYNKVKQKVEKFNRDNASAIRSGKVEERNPDKEFYMLSQRESLERAFPFSHSHRTSYLNAKKQLEYLNKQLDSWEKMEKKHGKDSEFIRDAYEAQCNSNKEYNDGRRQINIDENESASDSLKKAISRLHEYARAEKEGTIGYMKEIEKIKQMQDNVKEIETFGVNRTAENIAKAAMYALQKEEQLKKRDKTYKNMDPIYIAPENIFPESGYGSHPQELKEIIIKSREKMMELLRKKEVELYGEKRNNPYYRPGISKKEAEKIANDHIKATFDIGHAYTWKKYFKGTDEKTGKILTLEEQKEKFDKWLKDQIDDLNENDIIGHVHISDNFGYYDEHLTPGGGEVPIGKFIEKMKKNKNFNEPFVVEWGAQKDPEESYGAMVGAWARLASSPVYRINGVQQTWGDMQDTGYFGRSSSPSLVMGKYSPSKDWNMWTWSEAPIE